MGLRGPCGVQGIRPESAACTTSVLCAVPLLGPVRDLFRVVTTQTRADSPPPRAAEPGPTKSLPFSGSRGLAVGAPLCGAAYMSESVPGWVCGVTRSRSALFPVRRGERVGSPTAPSAKCRRVWRFPGGCGGAPVTEPSVSASSRLRLHGREAVRAAEKHDLQSSVLSFPIPENCLSQASC